MARGLFLAPADRGFARWDAPDHRSPDHRSPDTVRKTAFSNFAVEELENSTLSRKVSV